MVKFPLCVPVLVAACAFVLMPTVGLAGQSRGQSLQKLVEFTGKGNANSRAFRIRSSSVQVAYSYRVCSGKGGTGSFIVDLVGRGYNRIVVNVIGSHGKKRVWAYPRPGRYHVSVDSDCRWYVAVYGH